MFIKYGAFDGLVTNQISATLEAKYARRAVRDEQRTVLGICRSRATYALQPCVGYGVHRRAMHPSWQRLETPRLYCLPAI